LVHIIVLKFNNNLDCSVAPKVSNGNVALLEEENTTYGALAEITCETGYNFSVPTIQCRDTGIWDTATCDLIGNNIYNLLFIFYLFKCSEGFVLF
jgi:hypothetical protein